MGCKDTNNYWITNVEDNRNYRPNFSSITFNQQKKQVWIPTFSLYIKLFSVCKVYKSTLMEYIN